MILPIVKNSFISEREMKIFGAFEDRSTYRCGKLVRIIDFKAVSCELSGGPVNKNNNILLVGNSHADSIKTTFVKIAEQNKISTHFIIQNNPLMSGGLNPNEIFAEAKLRSVNNIVVHFSSGGIKAELLGELVALSEKGNIRVTFIDPVPTWSAHIPREMYFQLKGTGENLQQTKEEYMLTHEAFFAEIGKINSSNFERLSVVDYFCKPNCVYQNGDGTPLYFDSGHLTLTGSKVLEKVFLKAIEKNLTSGFK